ncbi:MAG: (2Fe-2S)-binding protein [Proteobacteria bacterium]|nr:(2Fe-2S)-binding protein [Pseudomonadota bacterium]
MAAEFTIEINGRRIEVSAPAERSLLDVIREDLGLTGTKRGCGIGACGACTVLIDGKPRRSCRIKLGEVACNSGSGIRDQGSGNAVPGPGSRVPGHGSLITTIEGLSDGNKLHPIQQAFMDCGAIQCGFCTPGMVLAAKALLDRNPSPTRDEIKRALAANLCRCTGYQQIFEAVEKAALEMKATR